MWYSFCMKVILYMATTLNGLIAKTNDDTSWISKEEWDSYSRITRAAGNLVVGHRTYDILTKQPEFSEFKDVRLVVVATKPVKLIAQNHHIAESPKRALEILKDSKEIVVAGGGRLNASFLSEDLVDEIYFDIEPKIFGTGIPVFHGLDFGRNLQLLNVSKVSENEVQLHFKVLK